MIADLFVMFNNYVSYNDAAGGKDHGFVVVCGYLSTFNRWQDFLAAWRRTLATYDVPYFHMREFSQSKGPFESWNGDEDRRARFLANLVSIIRNHVEYGVGSIVEFDIFDDVNLRFKLKEVFGNYYAFAARDCLAHMHQFLSNKFGRLPAATHIFEDGDEGKGHLLKVMEKDGYAAPIFRPKRDTKTKSGNLIRGVTQLQCADFAAYELRKGFKDDPLEEWLPWEHRKSLQALGRLPGWWGHYTKANLVTLCRNLKIPRRS